MPDLALLVNLLQLAVKDRTPHAFENFGAGCASLHRVSFAPASDSHDHPKRGGRSDLDAPGTRDGSTARGGEAILSTLYSGPRVVTGSDGRFNFCDLPARETLLELSGPHILQRSFTWDDAGLPEGGLSIVVSKSARLQVLLLDADEADGFSLLDEAGEVLPVLLVRAGELDGFREAPLFEGRSEVLQAPSEATRLILTLGGEIVREVSLRLEAGQLARVRL